MQIFVLDTSVLRDNSAIRGPVFEGFKAAAALEEFEVVVPEVVVRELAAHLADEVEAIEGKIRGFLKTSAFAGTIEWLEHDELGPAEIRDALRDRFTNAGFVIESVPSVDHTAVLDRLHSGLKPFGRGESESGYRDYLIWESALKAAGRGDVVLVTDNKKDFGSSQDPERVHEDLRSELGERSVRIRRTLHRAFEEDIRPRLESAEAYEQWFTDWVESSDFELFVREQLLEGAFDGEVPSDEFDFPIELDALQPLEVVKVHGARIESITRIDDDEILAEVAIHADVEFGQDLDTTMAEVLQSKSRDYFDEPEVTFDAKYRGALATVYLEGTASVAVVASTEGGKPEPSSAEMVAFDGP